MRGEEQAPLRVDGRTVLAPERQTHRERGRDQYNDTRSMPLLSLSLLRPSSRSPRAERPRPRHSCGGPSLNLSVLAAVAAVAAVAAARHDGPDLVVVDRRLQNVVVDSTQGVVAP